MQNFSNKLTFNNLNEFITLCGSDLDQMSEVFFLQTSELNRLYLKQQNNYDNVCDIINN